MAHLPAPARLIGDIAACVTFYTRLRLPVDHSGSSFAAAQWATPIAGIVVGICAGVALRASLELGLPEGVAAALALAISMLVTGCLHEDGLADVADGFGGGAIRERKLEIMRDSRIGTYGVAALGVTILLRWAAISALAAESAAVAALIAAHAASRAAFPAFMAVTPPARSDGLSAGVGTIPGAVVRGALALGALALLLTLGLGAAIWTAIALLAWGFALRRLAMRQIGGQTGDVLGALQQGGEIVVLLAACIFLI